MKLKFTKMQGAGNDFVVLNGISQPVALAPEHIRQLADRHFGIGFDQLLLVEKSTLPGVDFRYRIFNADGGEVEQCGNGARCFARFVHDQHLTDKTAIRVETQKGIIAPELKADGQVKVDMGIPRFAPADLPFVAESEALTYRLQAAQKTWQIGIASMGNPHAVLCCEALDDALIAEVGPAIQQHAAFPRQVNVGFMRVVDRHAIELRVYERGAGETLSCGTGACAAVVTGIRQGLLESPVEVRTHGGTLTIDWAGDDAPVFMTGPAAPVFEGEIAL
ncbi:MAG: diaminopimelate epimerase [Zoogloeaceae bacterium]|jgi:diaminopimelate epimerase|nr:diaminopimelate epimerase [Zoogloeaceae bacterium]